MAEIRKEMQKTEAQEPEKVERTRAARIFTPSVDIIERKDGIVLLADMPGVDETSVEITLEKNVLSIYGRVTPQIPGNMKFAYGEYGIGDYQRVFTLSDEIDRDSIEAAVKNGVLKLTMPKAKAAATRKIAVKADA